MLFKNKSMTASLVMVAMFFCSFSSQAENINKNNIDFMPQVSFKTLGSTDNIHHLTYPGYKDVNIDNQFYDLITFGVIGKVKSFDDNKLSSDDILAGKIVQKYGIDKSHAKKIIVSVQEEAAKHKLDPILVLSVIATESSFNPKARSHADALGLMQAIPKWHGDKMKRVGITRTDLFEIEPNIKLGSMILRDYLDKSKGNKVNALQRYNGSQSDKKYKYSNKVLRHYDWLLGVK